MPQDQIQNPKFSTAEIAQQIVGLGHSDEIAQKLAAMINAHEYAREPRQSPYITNTMVVLPSPKMGVSVVLESFGIEYARALQLEFDPNVLFYAAQPAKLFACWPDATGKLRRETFHPDFLVVSTEGVWFEETKPAEKLEAFLKKPRRYWVKTEEGRYRYIPGENNEFGVEYLVVTDAELSRTAIRNHELLLPYLSESQGEVCSVAGEVTRAIESAFALAPSMTINELTQAAGVHHSDVHKAILAGIVFYINDHQLLAEPDRCLVFASMERAVACAEKRLNPRKVEIRSGMTINVRDQNLPVIGVSGSKITVHFDDRLLDLDIDELPPGTLEHLHEQAEFEPSNLSDFSAKDIQEALWRRQCLKTFESTKNFPVNPLSGKKLSSRTIRRWQKSRDEGVASGLTELCALMPNRSGQGRRSTDTDDPTPLIPEEVRNLMDEFLKRYYLEPYGPSLQSTLGLLNKEIENRWPGAGRTVSYSSLSKRRNALSTHSGMKAKREGYRRGNVAKPSYCSHSGEKPMQGDYTFHVAEIDHTLADQIPVQIVDGIRQPLSGKLMLSVIQDSYSRMPLAWHFTLDSEFGIRGGKGDKATRASSARIAILMRKMISRHNRLPTRFHVDGGSDFKSAVFDDFLQHHSMAKSTRPPSAGKNGPLIERFFKTVNEGLFHQIGGSRKLHGPRHLRDIPKTHMADAHAQFTLEELNQMLEKFMTEVYPNLEHTGIKTTPAKKFEEGLRNQENYIKVTENEETLDLLLATDVGTRSIGRDGIRIRNEYFSSQEITDRQKHIGKKVKVRINPLDDSVIYALIDRRWVKLISKYNKARQFLTQEERLVASQNEITAKCESHKRSYQQRKVGDHLPFSADGIKSRALDLLADENEQNVEGLRDAS